MQHGDRFHLLRLLGSDLLLPLLTAALVDLSPAMLIAMEARCREVRYRVPAAVSFWLAVLDSGSSRAIV